MYEVALLLVTVGFTAVAQLLWKGRAIAHTSGTGDGSAAHYVFAMMTDPWTWGAIGSTGLGMISWMLVLRRMDLSQAFPAMALVYLVVPIAAFFVFRESLPPLRIAGIALILVGVAMTAASSSASAA